MCLPFECSVVWFGISCAALVLALILVLLCQRRSLLIPRAAGRVFFSAQHVSQSQSAQK